jgi:protocatechuate 3,4-dioxygenase beta subunit
MITPAGEHPLRPGRRAALLAGAAWPLAPLWAGLAPAAAHAAEARPVPLPAVSEGPFYPSERWRAARRRDWDADLTRVDGAAAPARGEHLALALRVVDSRGRAVDAHTLEIWQCDAAGQYHHARTESEAGERDTGFQGFGAARTAADGSVLLRTIRPVPYPGRTPHIHVKLLAPGGRSEWTSQLFLAGESGNPRDFLYRRLDEAERRALTLSLVPAQGDGLRWRSTHTLVLPG